MEITRDEGRQLFGAVALVEGERALLADSRKRPYGAGYQPREEERDRLYEALAPPMEVPSDGPRVRMAPS